MHREAQRGLQQLVLGHARAQAQHHLRHMAGDLARQLQPAAVDEEVDDREREAPAPEHLQGLRAVAHDVHDVSAAPQHGCDGLSAVEVTVN